MKYICQTHFDITATGITGHYKPTHLPFKDRSGNTITDELSWSRARNQQRNWETLTQILSLRAQLFDITTPVSDSTGQRWMFEFSTEHDGSFGSEFDPCEVLRSDSSGVPMLTGLKNDPDLEPYLITDGPKQNIWFAPVSINN